MQVSPIFSLTHPFTQELYNMVVSVLQTAMSRGSQVLFTKPTGKVDTGVFKVRYPMGEAFLSTLELTPSEKMNHVSCGPLRGYSYLELVNV